MQRVAPVITGIGVIAANGVGKEKFWHALETGVNAISDVEGFSTDTFSIHSAGELKQFNPQEYLGPKGLRNLDRNAKFLLVAAKEALDETQLIITEENTDDFGVCTGTTFSHLGAISEFDREVLQDGINFSNPALFPSTVLNAASSHVSIRFNIQGFNTTVSTGYTSALEALKYSVIALETDKAKIILSSAVDTLCFPTFFGYHKLGYMAGILGPEISCPFDKRRNGPLLGEAATVLVLEDEDCAKKRNARIYAKVLSVVTYFDAFRMGKIHPQGVGLEEAICRAFDNAGISPQEIDYISSCANSTQDLDKIEVKVLKRIFGEKLKNIPVSSIKSMIGETVSPASSLQIISSLGAMHRQVLPPTINYQENDPDCDVDCVPNQAQKKDVKKVLVTSFGPGGYNAACILEKKELSEDG